MTNTISFVPGIRVRVRENFIRKLLYAGYATAHLRTPGTITDVQSGFSYFVKGNGEGMYEHVRISVQFDPPFLAGDDGKWCLSPENLERVEEEE